MSSLLNLGSATILMASSCDDYSGAQEINCNVTGYFCYMTSYNNITVSYDGFFKKTTTCENVTTSELCPQGFYCPNTTELYACPAGSYCGAGSSHHYPCLFGSAACPVGELSAPQGGILFVILFGILCSMLFIMHRVAIWKIRRSQQKGTVNLTKEEKKQLKKNRSARMIESDQARVLKRYANIRRRYHIESLNLSCLQFENVQLERFNPNQVIGMGHIGDLECSYWRVQVCDG
jgi:hypothetical protein